MATFTPPTYEVGFPTENKFLQRFTLTTGISVIWNGTHFVDLLTPWLGEIRPWDGTELIEGRTWFQGGRTYEVDDITASLLSDDGYLVGNAYGQGGYGEGFYGGSE